MSIKLSATYRVWKPVAPTRGRGEYIRVRLTPASLLATPLVGATDSQALSYKYYRSYC